jgi:hypothetical protein
MAKKAANTTTGVQVASDFGFFKKLKTGDKYVVNGVTKLSDGMEIVPITPERYEQKIAEQAKAMSAGDIVNAMKK